MFIQYLYNIKGASLSVKHFRQVNDSDCDAVEELQPIDENLTYDFDFQVGIKTLFLVNSIYTSTKLLLFHHMQQLNHLQQPVHLKQVSKLHNHAW